LEHRLIQKIPMNTAPAPTSGKFIASCFAMAGFAVAIISALVAEVPTALALGRALVSMLACYVVGWIVGGICESVVKQHVAAQASARAVGNTAQESNMAQQVPDSEEPLVI
jgi:hypothetical protein